MERKLIMLIGPPSIGKTYLAQTICDNYSDADCLYLDERTCEDSDLFYNILNIAVSQNLPAIIVEGSFTTVAKRMEFFKRVRNLHQVKVIGVWIEASLSSVLSFNQTKAIPTDETEITRIFNFKVSPMETEPFDEMVYVMRETDVAIRTSDPVIKNVIDVLKTI